MSAYGSVVDLAQHCGTDRFWPQADVDTPALRPALE